jgi:hypothetical protein
MDSNMKNLLKGMLFIKIIVILIFACSQNERQNINSQQQNSNQISYLKKQGTTTQFIVDERPFLILGGELGNSSFTSVEYMKSIWPKLKTMNLNVGILKAEEGRFENNHWKVIRHLNGDQTHQGRHVRILLADGFLIQRLELYNYE